MVYKASATAPPETHYYVLNLQGDVVELIDDAGTTVAEYTYNAWGNITSILNASGNEIINNTNGTAVAFWNPLTYRGYIWDRESKLYYLESRYYDPVLKRFINADALASTGQGFVGTNMFAYCNNNPVAFADFLGTFSISVTDYYKIHQLVQIDLFYKEYWIPERYVIYSSDGGYPRWGRLDLYDMDNHVFYEVKIITQENSPSTLKQINNYKNSLLLYGSPDAGSPQPGTEYVSGTVYYKNYRIDYKSSDRAQGLIVYSISEYKQSSAKKYLAALGYFGLGIAGLALYVFSGGSVDPGYVYSFVK